MTRPILHAAPGFEAPVIEKVERLLEILDAIGANPILAQRLVLHGGTALNVFHANLPRLSVDIDLACVGSLTAQKMKAERPIVDAEIRLLGRKLGYTVRSLHDEHSGRSYRLGYGAGAVKIDVGYLARVPLLEPVVVACPRCSPTVRFSTLQLPELIAGKVCALLEREASRDLYDLATLSESTSAPDLGSGLGRAVALHAVSLADRFPFVRDPALAVDKFSNPSDVQVEELRSVLAEGDQPDFPELSRRARAYLAPLSLLTPSEAEYMDLLAEEADHRPEILFAQWPDVAERARMSPVAAWKVHNLRTWLDL